MNHYFLGQQTTNGETKTCKNKSIASAFEDAYFRFYQNRGKPTSILYFSFVLNLNFKPLDNTRVYFQNTKHSKLEKADILELTVRHLQRQKVLSSDVRDKYRAGFQECAREVRKALSPSTHLKYYRAYRNSYLFNFIFTRLHIFTIFKVTRFLECPELHMCSTGTGTLLSAGSAVIEPAVKQRLLRHLDTCSSEIDLDFSNSTVVIPDVSIIFQSI